MDLENYINENTCLHCGIGKPGYCEECYQDLIGENSRLQKENRNRYRFTKKFEWGCYFVENSLFQYER